MIVKLSGYENNLKNKCQFGNVKNKNNQIDLNTINDTFVKTNQSNVSFAGLNPTRIGKKLIGGETSKLGKKVARFAEDASSAVGGFFRRLKGVDELPLVDKPIIAQENLFEFTKNAGSSFSTSSRTLDFLQTLKDDHGIAFDSAEASKDFFNSSFLNAEGAGNLAQQVVAKAKAGELDTKTAKDLLDQINGHYSPDITHFKMDSYMEQLDASTGVTHDMSFKGVGDLHDQNLDTIDAGDLDISDADIDIPDADFDIPESDLDFDFDFDISDILDALADWI